MRPTTSLPLVLAMVLAGCSSEAAPDSTAQPKPPAGQRISETVDATLDGVPLVLEVADEPQERAVGLMGRSEVPDGTGMLFEFGEPVRTTFYMFQVPIPLTAVFVRDGLVVHVAQMQPCTAADSGDCPLYGPDDQEFDTVVETAPGTLPDVQPGDRLQLR